MTALKARLQTFKDLPALLGAVKASDVAAAVDSLLHDLSIDDATARGDFLEVARLENEAAE